MKNIKCILSSVLVLVIVTQPVAVSMAAAQESSPGGIESTAPAPRPSRAERRFFKQFDRKFKGFASEVQDMLGVSTDEELRQLYHDMITWLEQHGNYDMADAMLAVHGKAEGDIRASLTEMTSAKARLDAIAFLKVRIAEAGGFEAFRAHAKAEMKKNQIVSCEVGKIASYALIGPVMVLSMFTGMGAIAAVASAVVNPATIALAATTIAADGFVIPWSLNQILIGCYKERAATEEPTMTGEIKTPDFKNGDYAATCDSGFESGVHALLSLGQSPTDGSQYAQLLVGTADHGQQSGTMTLKKRIFPGEYKGSSATNSRIFIHRGSGGEPTRFAYHDPSMSYGLTCRVDGL